MNPNAINVIPYAPMSNNALISIALIVICICVIVGLFLSHRHKMKQAENDHTQAMTDIASDKK